MDEHKTQFLIPLTHEGAADLKRLAEKANCSTVDVVCTSLALFETVIEFRDKGRFVFERYDGTREVMNIP